MGKPDEMQFTLSNLKDRWVQTASGMRPLSELLHQEANGLDDKNLPRGVCERVKQLSDAHLRRSYKTGRLGLQAHTAVLATLEAEFRTCPILLCWRVWGEDQARALAHSDVRRPPVPTGGAAHRAMAFRWRTLRGSQSTERSVCGQIFPQNWR